MKKIISVFLSVVMLVSMCAGMEFSVQAADVSGYTAVSTKEDFYNMRNKPNGKYYLTDDIVFDSEDFIYKGDYYNNGNHWDSMGSFSGVLDGCGHTINGLVGDCAVANTNSGTIKNITIDNTNLIDSAICSINKGIVENCKLSNSSVSNGLVAENDSGATIRYCFSETSNAGICNLNKGTIDSCINNSDLTDDKFYFIYNVDLANVGGIANANNGLINNCINNGNISSNLDYSRTAGIAGTNYIGEYKYKGTVTNCTNTGNISGELDAGGIANNSGYVYDSINFGNINCTELGSGIGGNGCMAINCVNIGLVDNGGGYPICTYYKGYADGYVVDCYFLENSAVQRDDELAVSLTNDEINNEDSFSVLDFKDTWQITEDGISLQCTNKKQIATVIYQYPAKTYYNVGEKLNVSDMMVMTCDNKGEWLITDDYTVSGFTGQLGKNVITVKAGDCSASFNVYVRDSISNSKITLNATKFTATGKAIKPTVKVISNSGKILKLNTDYTLTYSANTNPGTATVTITGKGLYTGSVKKTFTITPMQTKGIKVSTRKTTSLKLAWTKQSGVTGYEVQKYDSKKKKWANYKTITSNTNSVTASKLTAGVTYKFRVRSYKTIGKTKYYGAYSSTLTTPTTPPTVSVKSSKITTYNSGKSTYKISWKKCSNVSGYQIQVYGFGYDGSNWKNHWKTITTVKGAGKTSYTSKKRFDFEDGGSKIRIRTYKEVNGKKYYGAWKIPKTKHVYKK